MVSFIVESAIKLAAGATNRNDSELLQGVRGTQSLYTTVNRSTVDAEHLGMLQEHALWHVIARYNHARLGGARTKYTEKMPCCDARCQAPSKMILVQPCLLRVLLLRFTANNADVLL